MKELDLVRDNRFNLLLPTKALLQEICLNRIFKKDVVRLPAVMIH